MRDFMEMTGNTSVAAWVPADAYADLILDAVVCYGQLSEVIGAIDYDMKACQGDTIQVRYTPARTAQGPIGACSCLSATSSTLGTYSITVQAYGDYDQLCGFSLFKACGPVKDRILNEMAKGLAKKRDQDIWAALISASVSYVTYSCVSCSDESSRDGSYCCAYKYCLYNSIVSIQKEMQGAAYNPDYVIMSPTVAKRLYYKDYAYPPNMLIQYNENTGFITSINGLKVIESCNATACSSTATTIAVVIDSSRAVGEAWGKRPTFEEDRQPECDLFKEVIWMYWGCNALDTGAIGHVRNP